MLAVHYKMSAGPGITKPSCFYVARPSNNIKLIMIFEIKLNSKFKQLDSVILSSMKNASLSE